MPRLTPLPSDTALAALNSYRRRLESLELAGGHPPKHAIARRSTTQSIPNNTTVAISFDFQVADTDGMFTPTSALVTAKTPGLFVCTGQTDWAIAATANTRLVTGLRINGGLIMAKDERTGSTTETQGQNVTITLPLVVGDTVELVVYQTNAALAARTISTSTYWPRLSVTRIGPAG
jgi:hypothetical protein